MGLPYDRDLTPAGRLIRFWSGFDFIQILGLALLLGIGLVFIYTTGEQVGTAASREFFDKQIQWIIAGTILFLTASLVDYQRPEVKVLSLLFYLLAVILLVAVFFIGVKVYGATRWLNIKPLGLRLQPSEFAKLAVTMLLAAMFSSQLFAVNNLRCFALGALTVLVPFVLILKEPDLGSALILLPVFAAIVFVAGLKWRYIFITLVLVVIIGAAGVINETMRIKPLLKDYQLARVKVFLDPESDLLHRGYNQYQAKLSVGSGGMTGKGIGEGEQNRLGFLPQSVSNNDFIFSVIAEETGFLGCSFLVFSYCLLLYSMLRTAFITPDPFGKFLAVGLAAIFFSHCYINIGMSVGLTPVTGVSLPFVSYGGSFILMGMTGLGILQSVYRKSLENP